MYTGIFFSYFSKFNLNQANQLEELFTLVQGVSKLLHNIASTWSMVIKLIYDDFSTRKVFPKCFPRNDSKILTVTLALGFLLARPILVPSVITWSACFVEE